MSNMNAATATRARFIDFMSKTSVSIRLKSYPSSPLLSSRREALPSRDRKFSGFLRFAELFGDIGDVLVHKSRGVALVLDVIYDFWDRHLAVQHAEHDLRVEAAVDQLAIRAADLQLQYGRLK